MHSYQTFVVEVRVSTCFADPSKSRPHPNENNASPTNTISDKEKKTIKKYEGSVKNKKLESIFRKEYNLPLSGK